MIFNLQSGKHLIIGERCNFFYNMLLQRKIQKPCYQNIEKRFQYCEILFIRGDPIFVVFVDGLAHEFKTTRIMNTISNIIVTIIF